MVQVQTGLENLLTHPPAWLAGQRLGLLCNPASVDQPLASRPRSDPGSFSRPVESPLLPPARLFCRKAG